MSKRYEWEESRALFEEGREEAIYEISWRYRDVPIEGVLKMEELGVQYLGALLEYGKELAASGRLVAQHSP